MGSIGSMVQGSSGRLEQDIVLVGAVGLDTASRDETLPAIIKREKKRLTDARENIWRRIEEQRLKMKWSQVFCYYKIILFSCTLIFATHLSIYSQSSQFLTINIVYLSLAQNFLIVVSKSAINLRAASPPRSYSLLHSSFCCLLQYL